MVDAEAEAICMAEAEAEAVCMADTCFVSGKSSISIFCNSGESAGLIIIFLLYKRFLSSLINVDLSILNHL